nr:hypothetical protein [Formosa haliotis]
MLNDLDTNYVTTFVKEKIKMRSGETDIAKSIINETIQNIGAKISNSLGHIGNLDCDILKHKNKYYVLELNPRFGGGYPFTHEAGGHIVNMYIDWLNGINEPLKHNHFKPNLTFSKCDRLIALKQGD